MDFEVSSDGIYTLESVWDDGTGTGDPFDGFLLLFDQPFDGVSDLGSIASGDDGDQGFTNSQITAFLEEGITYTALLTSFGGEAGNTGLQGDLRVLSNVGESASLVAVPEPGTGFALAAVFSLGLMVRHRRSA